ncbi:hypothetical protein A3762_09660 [Oleiphilus sp. HI0125]|uniref:DUF938 domain-containing protein n=1 Tax=Oleiphilus sp. HI0125 TaxID=1822266 RepID=UPI0007C3A973|nr:DUF938 domain-containing protein [Oleiphilus sp. HI0125]KZZ57608.1 hypothetical protein A3762_09660 [Oleiphilus sp. HI0125]
MPKPFSQSCENNKAVISDTLSTYVDQGGHLLEIGSGTGQHGAYMSGKFSSLIWQTSDRVEYHDGIEEWVSESKHENFLPPFELDVNSFNPKLLVHRYDYVFTANTLHIMSESEVEAFFSLLPSLLNDKGMVFVYGPFNYNGSYTSDSNAQFDVWLKEQGEHMGIRDFETINQLAEDHDLSLVEDHAMPANNRLLVWKARD